MLWEIVLGFIAAVILLVLLSVVLTALVQFYRNLFERRFGRGDLTPVYARFAAVSTLALLAALVLLSRFGL